MTSPSFLIPAKPEGNIIQRVGAGQNRLQRLNALVMALATGKKFSLTTNQYNYAAVILGGVCEIRTNKGNFSEVGRRTDVFTGMPYAVTIPPETDFEIESLSDDFQFAGCWATAVKPHKLAVVTPNEVDVRLHAVGRISYQINRIVESELSLWELYVPSTNWAQFPPQAWKGSEALLLLKQDRTTGFALHRLYTDSEDTALTSQHNDALVIPEGQHHTMVSSPIGVTYVLGMAHTQDPIASVDPNFAWYRKVYENATIDPRLPIVDIGMEPIVVEEK
jgi:5-deoxy-glucuronate isomerase